MRPLTRAGYLAHGQSPTHRRRLAEAEGHVAAMLARCAAPYVAFSAGKDSAVLLWLVAHHRPDIPVRLLASGETRLLHANFDAVLDWWRARFPALDLREILIDRVFAAGWEDADWATSRHAGRADIRTALPASGEFDGVFIGLRAAESPTRRRALAKQGPLYQYVATRRDALANQWRCCPLAWWRDEDVGAVIAAHDLPLLDAYHGRAGLATRTTLRLTRAAFETGALAELRERDPDAYRALLARWPELGMLRG